MLWGVVWLLLPGVFLAVDAQVIKAKVGCAALWGENGKVRVSGVGLVQEQEDLEHPRGLAC